MSCEYWEDVVSQLRDTSKCNWAAHVLSASLSSESNLDHTNLGAALACMSSGVIIEGAIYAYRDWSTQPYCDLILARFPPEEVLSVFRGITHPDAKMKVGVLGHLEDVSRSLAVELASGLSGPDEDECVREAAQSTLRAT